MRQLDIPGFSLGYGLEIFSPEMFPGIALAFVDTIKLKSEFRRPCPGKSRGINLTLEFPTSVRIS